MTRKQGLSLFLPIFSFLPASSRVNLDVVTTSCTNLLYDMAFNIAVHCCESVGDAGCLDENKEGGGPLPSPPHFSSSSTKTRPKEKTLQLKNGAETRRAELSLQPKQGSQDPWTGPYSTKTLPFRNFFLIFFFFAKTDMQVEHLWCSVIKGFIPPFSP